MLKNVYNFNTVKTECYEWYALLADKERKKFKEK